ELTQLDNWVKITNLPKTCDISIYSLNGNLIRRFTKDSEQTYLDWDLKNQYGIPIASGAYIIHVNAPGIGEKVVKFFGVQRPQDLNSL
ncbi:MAG: T9SS type A sorting domain-containing protein, partial [Bacteroidales bacterium]